MSGSCDVHLAGLMLARGGSKGIPLKNLAEVGGRPLMTWALRAAEDSNAFDSLWVSTDHDEIAKVARDCGAMVHRRTAEVSQDHTTSIETTKEFLSSHSEIDAIGLFQATSPCVQPDQLRQAAHMIKHDGYDSVFSVVRKHCFRWKEVASSGESTEALNFDPSNRPRRQDWNGELCENGGFYFARKHLLLKEGIFQGGKVQYIEMPAEHSIDIDTPFDLMVADLAVQRYGYSAIKPFG